MFLVSVTAQSWLKIINRICGVRCFFPETTSSPSYYWCPSTMLCNDGNDDLIMIVSMTLHTSTCNYISFSTVSTSVMVIKNTTSDVYLIHRPGGPYWENLCLQLPSASGHTQDKWDSFSQYGPGGEMHF